MKETLNKEHVIASSEGTKQSAVASEARQSHTIKCHCEERNDAAISTFSYEIATHPIVARNMIRSVRCIQNT